MGKRRLLLATGFVLAALLLAGVGASWWAGERTRRAESWAGAVEAFEEADRSRPFAPGGIVFTGSSSIRIWSSLERDMAPLPVLNRGFGGSHLAHVAHYLDALVLKHRPRAVVLYAGDNDLSRRGGRTPEQVLASFDEIVSRVHAELPETRIYFLAIKPSRLRWSRWPAMRSANRAIETRCGADPRITFLDVATPMLGPDGRPRKELFAFDGLHLSEAGYALWTRIVAPRLRADQENGRLERPR